MTHIGLESALVALAFLALGRLPEPYASYALVAAMLYTPLLLKAPIESFRPTDPAAARRWAWISVGFLLAFSLTMVAYAMGYLQHSWQSPDWQRLASYSGSTLLSAAIPEEWFFRGFVLARWQPALAVPRPWWRPSRANMLVSALFGVAHVCVDLNPARMIVAIPSLWYGAMAEQGAGLALCMTAHALSNILMYLWVSGFGF